MQPSSRVAQMRIAIKPATEKVVIDPRILEKIHEGTHLSLLIRKPMGMVHTVDFQNNTVADVYSQYKYTIFFNTTINALRPVICLLPNHKTEGKQLLASSDFYTLSSYNKTLNDCMNDSLHDSDGYGTLRLAVCYGKNIFECRGITGTVYILWAAHVTRTNIANVANTPFQNVPILINMDGQGRIRAAFIFKENVADESDLQRLPILEKSPILLWNKDHSLFVCEVKPVNQSEMLLRQQQQIVTMSRRAALVQATLPSRTEPAIFEREKNAFAASIDMEEVIVSDPDGGTPRADQLYMRNQTVTSRGFDSTPPLVRSEGEGADDAFE